MSATGSVNLIVCFSSSHPFAPHSAENLQRLVYTRSSWSVVVGLLLIVRNDSEQRPTTFLPGRLRNPWNFPAQRELAEAQAANAELAQKGARTSAQLAAVMLARGKLGLSCVFNSFCCSRQT
jgi:hypothetical protein